jgi:hypothetical protein
MSEQDATQHLDAENLAPRAEVYLPAPKFEYAPEQKQIDFAQIVASGGDLTEALSISSLITVQEKASTPRAKLYAMACRLLNNPAIQERVEYYTMLHKAGMNISAERIKQELTACSFSDFACIFHDKDGPLYRREKLYPPEDAEGEDLFEWVHEWRAGDPIRNPHHIPRYIRAAVKSFHIDKDGVVKVKFYDKLKAARLLGDMEGHFDEANRAKAAQINISIGDGKGLDINPHKRVEGRVIEAEAIDDVPDCLK